jgi:cystathionine beta-lyase/cystathionine gamma-synthase
VGWIDQKSRAIVEGADTPVPDHLLRLFVGTENPDDPTAELEQALAE